MDNIPVGITPLENSQQPVQKEKENLKKPDYVSALEDLGESQSVLPEKISMAISKGFDAIIPKIETATKKASEIAYTSITRTV